MVATDANLLFSKGVRIHLNAIVRAFDGGKIQLDKDVTIESLAVVEAKSGEVKIGQSSKIGRGCVIVSHESVTIGSGTLIAEYVTIRDQDHVFPSDNMSISGIIGGSIRIGDNVWIGAKATITRGVKIGTNSVIAAGAVVTKEVPSDCLVAGVPARVMKSWS